jgi:F-type H+-transporting ATPase subunit delta
MNSAKEIAEGIIQLLEKRGQIAQLSEVISTLTAYQLKQNKNNVAVVRTAVNLTDSERQMLLEQLSSMFGRTLVLEEHVDENIIGGMYIQVGDTVLDYTLNSAVKQVEDQIRK